MKKSIEQFRTHLSDFSVGYAIENGVTVERKGKSLKPDYRREAFYQEFPEGRIILDIKSATQQGVLAECRVFTDTTQVEPKTNGIAFFPGCDAMAFSAAQTKAERFALGRLGFAFPEESVEGEEIQSDLPMLTKVSEEAVAKAEAALPVLGADGAIHAPSTPVKKQKATKAKANPEPETTPAAEEEEEDAIPEKESVVSEAEVETALAVEEPEADDAEDLTPPAEEEEGESLDTFLSKVIPDGKHKGLTVERVLEIEPDYIEKALQKIEDPAFLAGIEKRFPKLLEFFRECATLRMK